MSRAILEQMTEVFKPQLPLWACEFTSKHVIVAGVSKKRDRIEAKTAAELPENSVLGSLVDTNILNVDGTRSKVRDALMQAGFKGSEIAVVVPDDATRIAFVTAENMPKDLKERQTFLRWKLKKTVPFDVDAAQIAFRMLGQHDVLVVLSPRPIVEEYENLFDSLDIHAGFVVPSTLAALNLFIPPAEDTLFLKIAPDCITTTVFQRRRIQFYRRVTDVSLYDAVYPTLMYYQDKLGGSAIRHVTVCGYDSDLHYSMAEIQEKLGLIAQRLQPMSVDDVFKPVLGGVHLSWQSLI